MSQYNTNYPGYNAQPYATNAASPSGYNQAGSGSYSTNTPSGYPPSGYPPSGTPSGYPPSRGGNSGYPPSSSGYPPSSAGSGSYSNYSATATNYSQPSGYPPSSGGSGYPPSNQPSGYPPSSGGSGYPPSSSGYPPSSSGYPPSGGSGYPPSTGASGYPPSGGSGYPPTNTGYPPSGGNAGYASASPAGYPPRTQPQSYTTTTYATPTPVVASVPMITASPAVSLFPAQPFQQVVAPVSVMPTVSPVTTNFIGTAYQQAPAQPGMVFPGTGSPYQQPGAPGAPAPGQPYASPQQTNQPPAQQPNPYAQPQPTDPFAAGGQNPYAGQPSQPGAPGAPGQPYASPQQTNQPPAPPQQDPFAAGGQNPYALQPNPPSQPPQADPASQPAAAPQEAPKPDPQPAAPEPPKVVEKPAPTPEEMHEKRKMEIEAKMREQRDKEKLQVNFFAEIVETTQIIANNSNRVLNMVAEADQNDLFDLTGDNYTFFADLVKLVSETVITMHDGIKLNVLNLDSKTQALIEKLSTDVSTAAQDLFVYCNEMFTPEKIEKFKKMDPNERTMAVKKHVLDVNQAIRAFVSEIHQLRNRIHEKIQEDSEAMAAAESVSNIVSSLATSGRAAPSGKTLAEIGQILYKTELEYETSLSKSIDFWLTPLKASIYDRKPLVTRDGMDKFALLEKLSALSKTMVAQFQEAAAGGTSFGDLFIANIAKLKLYVEYTESFDGIVTLFDNLSTNKDFMKWYRNQMRAIGNNLSMAAMLVWPMSRLGRYFSLLTDMLKTLKPDDIDYPVINQAKDIMQDLFVPVASKKRQFESALKMKDFIATVKSSAPLPKEAPGRIYVYDGAIEFKREGGGERRSGHLYVMSDLVVVTQLVGKKGNLSALERHWITSINVKDMNFINLSADSVKLARRKMKRGLINTIGKAGGFPQTEAAVAKMSPLLVGDVKGLRIDPLVDNATAGLELDIYDDLFKLDFQPTRHFVYMGKVNDDVVVIHVSAIPSSDQGNYKALLSSKTGYQEIEVTWKQDKKTPLNEGIQSQLFKQYPGIHQVTEQTKFNAEFVRLESSYPQRVKAMKIGIVYLRDTYSEAKDLTAVDPQCGASFHTFLNLMGRKISLANWTGYKGDMGSWKAGETYYEEFQEVEVIYHVAPFLSATQHRQWIGNDSLIIIFQDEEAPPFKLEHIGSLGTIPSVFAVVKPARGGRYNVAFFSAVSVRSTLPSSPAEPVDGPTMKQLILTKMHNGSSMLNYCPPLNRNFYLPRQEFLKQLLIKFPKTKEKIGTRERIKEQMSQFKKGSVFPPVGDSPASFQLVTDDEGFEFFCPAGSTSKWVTTIDNVLQGYRLNNLTFDASVTPSGDSSTGAPKKATGGSAAAGTTPYPTTQGGPTGDLIILSATYGVMGPSMADVTRNVQVLVHGQGGNSLVLNPGSKKNLFTLPKSKDKGKIHLCIIYKVKEDGDTQRITFKDEDAVRIP